jgi:hypothetical protein
MIRVLGYRPVVSPTKLRSWPSAHSLAADSRAMLPLADSQVPYGWQKDLLWLDGNPARLFASPSYGAESALQGRQKPWKGSDAGLFLRCRHVSWLKER